MLSYPLNSSTTVLYYNKDAFKRAGLDPSKAPATWPELVGDAARLKAAGERCPFTTSWQGWTQLESFSTWHNVEYATLGNGFGGVKTRLVFNAPLQVRHIENLSTMSKQGLFVYKGRGNVPDASFHSGECSMITASSSAYGNVAKNAKFGWAMATLPYYPDVPGAPQNTVIGGASLWVMAGKPASHYKGVAAFFNYLTDPAIQANSHQTTGDLPLTMAAYELTMKSGFYDRNPGADTAVEQMIRKTTDKSRGIRLGNMVQIRAIVDEELESVWAGKQGAKDALDQAVKRGNQQLERFERSGTGH